MSALVVVGGAVRSEFVRSGVAQPTLAARKGSGNFGEAKPTAPPEGASGVGDKIILFHARAQATERRGTDAATPPVGEQNRGPERRTQNVGTPRAVSVEENVARVGAVSVEGMVADLERCGVEGEPNPRG